MKQKNMLLYVSVSVLLVVLFFFFFYQPRNKELRTLHGQRTKVEAEVANLKKKKKEMDRIEKELIQLQADLKQLEVIIPNKREISDILNQFQALAFNSRLNITKFTPRGETPREFYSEWPIPIEVTGNYNNLGMFFDRLSRFNRLFTIERFTLKALARQSEASTITANFTSKTYIFLENIPPPEPATKAGAKASAAKRPARKTG